MSMSMHVSNSNVLGRDRSIDVACCCQPSSMFSARSHLKRIRQAAIEQDICHPVYMHTKACIATHGHGHIPNSHMYHLHTPQVKVKMIRMNWQKVGGYFFSGKGLKGTYMNELTVHSEIPFF